MLEVSQPKEYGEYTTGSQGSIQINPPFDTKALYQTNSSRNERIHYGHYE